MLSRVALASLLNRRWSAALTVLAIAVSAFVFLSVEQVRQQAKTSFSRTVSGVDLIVGPRTGQLNLLLATVFRIGAVPNGMSMESVDKIARHPMVRWSVPLSLGDSHKGYRVLGTTRGYFEHYRYGRKQALAFAKGEPFQFDNELVLGAEVAEQLGYSIGTQVVLSHGIGVTSFSHHEQFPFTVTGILQPTGTPVDQTLHISLQGVTMMHASPEDHTEEMEHSHEHAHEHKDEHKHRQEHNGTHQPEQVSAVLLGLKAKYATLMLQQGINKMNDEPLMAIVPGVALTELWRILGSVETLLRLISLLVLVAALLGMSTMLLASMRERKREVAVLRAMGARPSFIFTLIEIEVLMLTAVGLVIAMVLVQASLYFLSPVLASHYGIFLQSGLDVAQSSQTLIMVFGLAMLIGLVPAFSAYRQSLQSHLS